MFILYHGIYCAQHIGQDHIPVLFVIPTLNNINGRKNVYEELHI